VDYETAASHTLTVIVSDAGTPTLSTTVVVNVIVQNVNDGPPAFSGTFDVSKAENVAIGTSVADVSAMDPDGAVSVLGNPQHSIISGDPSGRFNIDSSTGRVTTRAVLDAESTAKYTMVIKAVEQGGTGSATVTLTVTVTDVNDVTPSCSAAYYAASVSESAAVGTSVKDISCVDNDLDPAGLNNAVTYAITSGNAGGIFAVDAAGKVTVATASLDRETTPSYTLEVKVVDTATTGKLTATVTVQVTVTDENDNTPVFTGTPYAATVPEDSAIGFTALTVAATDADVGSNGRCS